MTFVTTTDDCPARERLDLWREVTATAFVPLAVREPGGKGFHGELRSAGVGTATLSEIRTSACVVERTPRLIRRSDPGYFKIEVQLAGSAIVEQGGRTARLSPGDFVLCDTSRPYRLAFPGEAHLAVLMLPRADLSLPAGLSEQVTAVAVPGSEGLGRVASTVVATLTEQLDAVEPAGGLRVAESVTGLLRAALLTRCGAPAPPSARADTMRAQIRAYVDAHLDDPGLCPQQVADAQYISLRYLHKLFETEDVTVAELIRARRLERCRRDIEDPALAGLSLSEIGGRWGMPDLSTFSRAFRAAYGMAPSEYRRACTGSQAAVRAAASAAPRVPATL
ncbi:MULTISPECIES: helix-turn-helix domain-containing protein [Amycolatopsis]|uniref:AraC-type DNA-binding protein n=2 Tax=Amycolatopsis TaxID=1813 RepID=A0A1I3RK53_9PSEU|nr:helix-turn-helix domain-containing protein [Amycolatopsis sacchari]SFJ46222.1 AraC-type DNA-binding protein [Amycolatopsis sacchari]